ncbi:class I SAM-dependent methyltransferase [Edaphobacter albus]|uniref:class I SAM-dependent methyltransferase n=1 Tax=Edaphobacter sp. 4G125 TaxID=2763071 RepID=UPI001647BA2E|nr:class I SAM-dependent methyltransferase [Edaphobacter sp. 4G125]QNI36181.1 class I SAM-dependent methyltransferase [Edaphobacter sp. 4G125]
MSTPSGFDRIARPYRLLEYLTLGQLLERTRLHFLPYLLTARNALVIGDGDGRFLTRLFAANPSIRATAIDVSAEMLRLLSKRCTAYTDRLSTCQIDALKFMPPEDQSYDLVVTHFFLDCLTQTEIEALVTRLTPALAPGTLWVVSDFRVPPGLLRWPAQLFVRGLYIAFRILTGLQATQLPHHASALQSAGFRRIEKQLFMAGILTTELWQITDNSAQRHATSWRIPASY